jgi:hypothetical protein
MAQTLAAGTVASSDGAIFTNGGPPQELVTVVFHNISASVTQTLIVSFTIAGGTEYAFQHATLAPHEQLIIQGLPMGASDILSAVTTTASVVNYTVFNGFGPYQVMCLDINGAIKQVNSGNSGNLAVGGSILSSSPTGGVGYTAGAGGTVTQTTSRTTSVTINDVTGAITLVSAAGSATPFTMTVTNSSVAAADTVVVSQKSGTDAYQAVVSAVAAGSFKLTITDLTGTTTETPVFNFAVLKGSAS